MKYEDLTEPEKYKYTTIQSCIQGDLTNEEAAELLNIKKRQVQRMKREVEANGIQGIRHGLKDKVSNNRLPTKTEKQIVNFLNQKKHRDFGPTFAGEQLAEIKNIALGADTIRAIMIRNNLWKPKPERTKAVYRHCREPMAKYGELIQFDGSYHDWNEDGQEECLLLAIDDATSSIPHAAFADNEGVNAVFRFFWDYVEQFGRPVALYLDKFSTYKVNHKNAEDNHELMTQFERAMKELDIKIINAHSPQAKGRVERSFGTHQDRLVKGLRLSAMTTRTDMNHFLQETYLPKHNEQFARPPKVRGDAHRPLTKEQRDRLPAIFAKHYNRLVRNDFTVQWQNQWFQLSEIQKITVFRKDTILIEERLDGTIHLRKKEIYLDFTKLTARPKANRRTKQTALTREPHRPAKDHPWRRQKFGKTKFSSTD
ncbi:MAG TPA: ISNCY family transposase [Candidatus Paceibacterota bacterium]|nr:ISNCY family transposase [Candidatus Paceibacterota bacterium]